MLSIVHGLASHKRIVRVDFFPMIGPCNGDKKTHRKLLMPRTYKMKCDTGNQMEHYPWYTNFLHTESHGCHFKWKMNF